VNYFVKFVGIFEILFTIYHPRRYQSTNRRHKFSSRVYLFNILLLPSLFKSSLFLNNNQFAIIHKRLLIVSNPLQSLRPHKFSLSTRLLIVCTVQKTLVRANMPLVKTNMCLVKTNVRLVKANMRLVKANMPLVKTNMRLVRANMRLVKANMPLVKTNMLLVKANMSLVKADKCLVEAERYFVSFRNRIRTKINVI